MRNRIINGAMTINQRGFSGTPNFEYTLDRWVFINTQTGKFTLSQNAGSVTPPAGFSNYLGLTSTSAFSVASSDTFLLSQFIEGFNTSDLGWGTANAKTVTLSFQVYSSLTGTFGGAIVNSANNRSYPFSYTVTSANTWTSISVTIAGDTSGTWVGATNGIGLRVRFGLGSGATFSGTAGAWAAGDFVQPTGTVSVVGTNGATFYITGVQLEVGTQATSFEYRQYGTELALCQRYAYKRLADGSIDSFAVLGQGRYYGTDAAQLYVPFPVTMRTSPSSITISGSIYVNGTTLSGASWTSTALNETSCDGATVTGITTTGTTAGNATTFYANNTAVAYIIFNAEL
jgi:hypothetical protein